ncbi:MAG: Gfo/Idh/MocA family oxidoreductase [Longimicrobiales bacterium]
MNPAKDPVRVAIVGTGAISQVVHVPILAERQDVDVVALADVDLPKARTIADRFGVPDALPPSEVFDRDDIRAVVLCTPNHLHEEQALAALEAGKDVFVERPLALSADGVERILDAARAAGTVLIMGSPHRFRPDVSALRSFVAGGELGRVYSVRGAWLTRRVPVVRATWRHDRDQAGGGALVDLGVPALDLCMWLVGYPEIARVTCSVARTEHEVEDAATLLFESTDGVVFTVEVSNRYFAAQDRYYARVLGTEGSGALPELEVFKQLGGRPLEVTPRQPRPRGGENPYTNAYRRQLDHFVRGLAGEVDCKLPVEQVALMRLIEAAYRSAEEGRQVEV